MNEENTPWQQRLKQMGSSSLLHFLVIGGLCFALAPASESTHQVAVTAAQLKAERDAQKARLGQRSLTPEQRAEVDQRVVHDALLYREAQRLGLGHGDGIIRQRMVQKMLFLALRLAGATQTPDKATLRRWFQREQRKGSWRAAASIAFQHIYFRTRDASRFAETRRAALAHEKKAPGTLPKLGDAFPDQRQLPLTSQKALARRFGPNFAKSIQRLPSRQWSQAIASRYGWHLIYIHKRTQPRPYRFEEVIDQVRFQWILDRKQRAKDELLRRLYQRYQVQVAGYKAAPFQPQ